MLKLATVFSGIGAIEHALERMNIEYKIIFASDNGDINIFEKKIPISLISIKREIKNLEDEIENLEFDETELKILSHLQKVKESFNDILGQMNNQYNFSINLDYNIFTSYIEKYKLSDSKIGNVLKLYDKDEEIYDLDKLIILEVMRKKAEKAKISDIDIITEYNYLTEDKIFKKFKSITKEIIDNIIMLYEKIGTIKVRLNLDKLSTYKEKKQYIDNLYKDKNKSNYVKKSYFANYDIEEENFHWNVCFIDGKQYKDNIDLFVGGSPCQSFSAVGKQRGLQDTRGTLFYEYARLVKEIQPKVFIYENVRAVLSNDNGQTWEVMQNVFDEVGYNWKLMVLNAKDYGIPQNRERIFVVGFRKDIILEEEFEEPKKIELEKTMKNYLIDNVSGKYYLNDKGVKFVTDEKNLQKRWTQIDGDIQLCQKKNQQFNWHGDFVFEEENKNKEKTIEDLKKYFLSEKVRKYVLSSGTGKFYSRPEIDLDVARPLLTTMHKMHRAGIDNYVTTDGRIRKLTPRECLRLMGFCDSFKIVVSDTQAYQQAGNSIVVNVLVEIMKKIIKSLPEIRNGEGYKFK